MPIFAAGVTDTDCALATVTEEDIAASLELKRDQNDDLENDLFLGDSHSYASDESLSSLSACSMYSLGALKKKKVQLIESIKSQLNSSRIGDGCSTPNVSFTLDNHFFTSTPYKGQVPPAAKFLDHWKGFSNIDEIAEKNESSESLVEYEEAFESLREILGESKDWLGAYESALEVYTKNEDKKLEEMMNNFDDREDRSTTDDITVIELARKPENDKLRDGRNTTFVTVDTASISEVQITDVDNKHSEHTATNNDEVVRKELDLGDPENVIAAEESFNADLTLVNEEDEERLLASDNDDEELPDSESAVTPLRIKEKEFISNDPDENRDNNDPQWECLRNLGSDFERYRAVRQRWRNIDIPNPKKDLTCRCERVLMNRVENIKRNVPLATSHFQSRKRPHSPNDTNNNNSNTSNKKACTVLFDEGIRKVLGNLWHRKQKLEQEQKRTLTELADKQQLERISACHCRNFSDQELRIMKMGHEKETWNLLQTFRHRRQQLMAYSDQQIEALRRAADEVREFHEFYPAAEGTAEKAKGDSLTCLSPIEVEEVMDIEKMFVKFENFYALPSYV